MTEKRKPEAEEIYGAQGNTGQYGQGQYDSEGRPDPHGKQAQQARPAQEQPAPQGKQPTDKETERKDTKQ